MLEKREGCLFGGNRPAKNTPFFSWCVANSLKRLTSAWKTIFVAQLEADKRVLTGSQHWDARLRKVKGVNRQRAGVQFLVLLPKEEVLNDVSEITRKTKAWLSQLNLVSLPIRRGGAGGVGRTSLGWGGWLVGVK